MPQNLRTGWYSAISTELAKYANLAKSHSSRHCTYRHDEVWTMMLTFEEEAEVDVYALVDCYVATATQDGS